MAVVLPLLSILGLFTLFNKCSQNNNFFTSKRDDEDKKNLFEKDKFERQYQNRVRQLDTVDSKQNSTPIEIERQIQTNEFSGVRTNPSKHVKPLVVHIDGGSSNNSNPSVQPDNPTPNPQPDLRPVPAPTPDVQPAPAPTPVVERTPTPEVRPAPTPVVERTPTPEVRPAPAPRPDVQPIPTPAVRRAPMPDVRPAPPPVVVERAPVVQPMPAPEPVGFSPYWDLRRPMDFDVNFYDFDFIPKRNIGTDKVSGFVDGPFTHNGAYYVRESRGKRFVMDLHFGNNSTQDSDMRVHVVIDNGNVNISGTVQGQAIPQGGITVPLHGKGTRSNPYRFVYNDPNGTTHTIKWCPA